MKSPNFRVKLEGALAHHDFLPIEPTVEVRPFRSQADCERHLAEGSLFGISQLAADALSIPCGKYMVWMTNAGHTMLVPPGPQADVELFPEGREPGFEIATPRLVRQWRTLAPAAPGPGGLGRLTLAEDDEGFTSRIDMATVDRTPLARAMADRGMTVTELAAQCGVDPPAISRILREPKDVAGDPGGRNPSMELASKICAVLRLDPKSAFPDFFRQDPNHTARQQPSNAKSGQGFKKAGAVAESFGATDMNALAGGAQTAPLQGQLDQRDQIRQQEHTQSKRELEPVVAQLSTSLDRMMHGHEEVDRAIGGTAQAAGGLDRDGKDLDHAVDGLEKLLSQPDGASGV